MSHEWEQLTVELKKMPRGVEDAPAYLRHLMRLFVADFEASMSKRFDIKFWSKLKNLMDEMRKATENDRLVDVNTQNLAVGFLTDLSLLCHYHYEIPEFGMPRHLTWTPTVCHTRKRVESVKNCRVFAAYIMLRMGDLMRYKNYLDIAKTYYELSARLNPADGATWNQLGVSATLRAQTLESVYFHTRALHATHQFSTASANLTSVFKKFANRDTTTSMPINQLFLTCLAKIHFLLEIKESDKILKILGKHVATSKEMLVSLLSVYQHLESGTDLENRAIAYANVIWSHAHQHLLEKLTEKDNDDSFTENLQLFALLRNAVRISGYYEILAEKIQNHENHLKDTHGFAHFHCPTALKFPLKLEELLGRENEQEPVDIGEENEEENEEEEEQEKGKNYHKESDSSDEEILQRGRRRGRARQLESVDTDEEDF